MNFKKIKNYVVVLDYFKNRYTQDNYILRKTFLFPILNVIDVHAKPIIFTLSLNIDTESLKLSTDFK